MTDDKKRGRYLAELRKKKGLKQTDLAELLHYTDKNVSKWENGKSYPKDPDILNKLAKTFDVPLEELIYGGEKPNQVLYKDNKSDNNYKGLFFKKNIKNIFHNKIIFFLLIAIVVAFLFIFYVYFNRKLIYYSADIDNFNIKKSSLKIFITSKYNNLEFTKISLSTKIINKVIFYYKINNKEYILFESENEDYSITEYSGYNEYNLDKVVKSECYIKLIYDDNSSDTIKLKFNKII